MEYCYSAIHRWLGPIGLYGAVIVNVFAMCQSTTVWVGAFWRCSALSLFSLTRPVQCVLPYAPNGAAARDVTIGVERNDKATKPP